MKIIKMIKKIKILIIVCLLSILTISFYAFRDDDDVNFEISKNLDIFYSLFRELTIYYVDDTDPSKLVKKAIDEMLSSLDPYTVYIPESRMEDYRLMTTGQYGGIGAIIRKNDDYVIVVEPHEYSPAQKAGLRAGDIIVAVDNKSIKGKSTSDVSELLKGQPGTEVKLTIERYGHDEQITIPIKREIIKINEVPYYGMLNEEIGYIQLNQFTQNVSDDVKKALLELKEKDAKKIIIDLRGNPGGLLIEAVNICNLFIDKGQEIVSTKGKIKQWDKTYKTMHDAVDSEIPLIILVNKSSASASEIVAGAIQDLDRGVILGERTFGKGLVQTTRDLSYNSKLKVTVAKYYIPSGRCIQALDYSHRNPDGSVGKIPDSLISEFNTKNGRLVYDGGGIEPDIKQEPPVISKITLSLLQKNLIFDYATVYASTHDTIRNVANFIISDEDYEDFLKFLEDKDFDYETNSESKLDDLIDIAKKEKYYSIATDQFEALKQKLAHDKNKDLQVFKDEIKEILSEEIISRYHYRKGRIENMLQHDPLIKEAVDLFQNIDNYNNILNPLDNREQNNDKNHE
ncbi:MAG: S41 family peptidase [Marinilabiliales bacterium]